tara:strand:+ start:1491 stop:1862 length:372 start_codon:yes stop_codon:yes gene_type:complete
VEKTMERKIVSDKNRLFTAVETECHHLKVAPDSDEYMKVWVKEPTWLQVEQAMSSVMKLDPKTQGMEIDMNKMWKFMVENFIEKTEPQLSGIEILRLSPYVGAQLKEILPNPLTDSLGDDMGN